MPLGTMTAPVFWHSQENQPQAHKLPDVKSSDRKARVLLRRLRTGSSKKTLVVVPSTTITTPTAESQLVQPQQQPQQEENETTPASSEETIDRPTTSTPSLLTPSEAETATTTAADDPPEELPVLPAYVARPGAHEQPPPYAGQILPPALPGYTPLPLPGTTAPTNPARDLKQPNALLSSQRRYRNVLRRRISATKRLFGVDSGPETAAAAESEDPSARGVVMYRDRHDRWVGADEMDEMDELKFMQARQQTGLKGWLKRVWAGVKDFMEEHPMLFFVALFVIIVVALCILI